MHEPRHWLRPSWHAQSRPGRRLAFGAACLATVLVAGWGGSQVWWAEAAPPTPPTVPPSAVASGPPTPMSAAGKAGLDRSAPVELMINSINVRAGIDQIGLAQDGTLEEQPLSRASYAAWYRLGAAPGQVGPAVITGHVDTKSTLGVFFYLSRLRPGDRVVITRADDRTVSFAVDSVASFPKSNFPTQLVYGATDYPALRLVTCGGQFDRRTGSYEDNVVVFGHLIAHT
jgi:Sortase domain